jgi:hypothetical protein
MTASDLTLHMSSSILVILWWVSMWAIIEEGILFVSGNRKQIKMLVCAIIIAIVIITCAIFPHHIERF